MVNLGEKGPDEFVGWTGRDSSVKPVFIQSLDELVKLCDDLQNEPLLAFDTEFVAEDSYRPELCLLQVSSRNHLAIIDSLLCESMAPFWPLLLDPDRTVVVHAGREEILFCFRATGQTIPNLFDIQVAAAFIGCEYPASYGNLVQRFVGKTLGKEETRSDWRQRPLTHRQLEYAAQDVRDLPAIYDYLQQELGRRGRLAWLQEEMERRQEDLAEVASQEAWHRIPGVQSLSGQTLAVARALWLWRENHAVERDIPARRVLRDDLLIELARRGSDDPNRIANLRGMNHRHVRSLIDQLADCISEAKHAPVPSWPKRIKYGMRQPSTMLTQFLSAALALICRNKDISPAIVGTHDDLRDFALYRLDERSSHLPPPSLLRGWRQGIIGEQLDDLLAGRIGIVLEDPLDEIPLRFCEGNAGTRNSS